MRISEPILNDFSFIHFYHFCFVSNFIFRNRITAYFIHVQFHLHFLILFSIWHDIVVKNNNSEKLNKINYSTIRRPILFGHILNSVRNDRNVQDFVFISRERYPANNHERISKWFIPYNRSRCYQHYVVALKFWWWSLMKIKNK